MAYVIIDLFSRFVVGWMVAAKECKHLAAQLFSETIARHGVTPGLLVHSDRGPTMRSDTLAQLLDSLGASRSFSRPRVSNDNPYSEAHFKTLKYQPDYPGCFASALHGRACLQDFFAWHNDHHHHSGLALFTPADVFHGRVAKVAAVRQAALDAAYRAHPERFPTGRRACRCRLPPCTSTPSSRRRSRSPSRSPLRPLCQRTPQTEPHRPSSHRQATTADRATPCPPTGHQHDETTSYPGQAAPPLGAEHSGPPVLNPPTGQSE